MAIFFAFPSSGRVKQMLIIFIMYLFQLKMEQRTFFMCRRPLSLICNRFCLDFRGYFWIFSFALPIGALLHLVIFRGTSYNLGVESAHLQPMELAPAAVGLGERLYCFQVPSAFTCFYERCLLPPLILTCSMSLSKTLLTSSKTL